MQCILEKKTVVKSIKSTWYRRSASTVVTETYSVEQVERLSESMLELAKVMVSAYVMELGPLPLEVEDTGWSQEHK